MDIDIVWDFVVDSAGDCFAKSAKRKGERIWMCKYRSSLFKTWIRSCPSLCVSPAKCQECSLAPQFQFGVTRVKRGLQKPRIYFSVN